APLAPARALLDGGAHLAIASNCNPGTSYTSSMSFCVTTAVLQQQLSIAEALRAATRGGALALRRGDVGPLGLGARADLHVLDAPAAIHRAYRPGMPLTHAVWRAGRRVPWPGPPPQPAPRGRLCPRRRAVRRRAHPRPGECCGPPWCRRRARPGDARPPGPGARAGGRARRR